MMKKLLFLPLFICLALIGFLPVSVEAGYPYSMTYTVSAGDTILADHYNTGNNEHINNNIPESIDDYSATVSEMGATKDPYAGDTEVQAVTLDEEIQELRHAIDQLKKKFNTSATKWYHDATDEGVLWVTGADVTSSAALPLINDGLRVDVTGTDTVTSMDAVGVGTVKCLQFDDALTLTHHSTDLILPNDANIITVAGDRAWFHEYATGDWELIGWDGHIIEHTHFDTANGGTLNNPSFSVHKNGSNQTAVVTSTWTKLTWSTEDFDTNSDFASDKFTPTVAGKYMFIITAASVTNMAAAVWYQLAVYKNGSAEKYGSLDRTDAAQPEGIDMSCIAEANGSTDYFEAFIYHTKGSDIVIDGDADDTWFQGFKIAE